MRCRFVIASIRAVNASAGIRTRALNRYRGKEPRQWVRKTHLPLLHIICVYARIGGRCRGCPGYRADARHRGHLHGSHAHNPARGPGQCCLFHILRDCEVWHPLPALDFWHGCARAFAQSPQMRHWGDLLHSLSAACRGRDVAVRARVRAMRTHPHLSRASQGVVSVDVG